MSFLVGRSSASARLRGGLCGGGRRSPAGKFSAASPILLMNRLCFILLCLFSGAVFAQQPPPATPPPRPAPFISPEVKEGRNVTFRLRAPKATEVLVRGQWAKEP